MASRKMGVGFGNLAIYEGPGGGVDQTPAGTTKDAEIAEIAESGQSAATLVQDGTQEKKGDAVGDNSKGSSVEDPSSAPTHDSLMDPFLPVTTPFSPTETTEYSLPTTTPLTHPASPGFENAPGYGFADIIISPAPELPKTDVDEEAVSHYLKQLQDRAENSPNTLFEPLLDYLPLTEKGVGPFIGKEDGGNAIEEYQQWQTEIKGVEKKRIEAIREAHERLRLAEGRGSGKDRSAHAGSGEGAPESETQNS
jgi:hypothetical protein